MTTATPHRRRPSPLLIPATTLSLASLAWTTWSLVDLLGAGWIGVTVAAGADVVWASVILAEARGLRAGRRWVVPALGWTALLVVAAFLAWHGINRHSAAMAAAGPFLPLGAKAVWVLALTDMRDPAQLTDDERAQLATLERGMLFEEARHRVEMRRRRMDAELLMAGVETDFDIEVTRQDRARELQRRRPLQLTAGPAPSAPDTHPDTTPDTRTDPRADTPGQADTTPDTDPGHSTTASTTKPPTSTDTHPDTPDALAVLAAAASGPAQLVRDLAAHGVPMDQLVSNAVRLRPDMNRDSIRRTAQRLATPYL